MEYINSRKVQAMEAFEWFLALLLLGFTVDGHYSITLRVSVGSFFKEKPNYIKQFDTLWIVHFRSLEKPKEEDLF